MNEHQLFNHQAATILAALIAEPPWGDSPSTTARVLSEENVNTKNMSAADKLVEAAVILTCKLRRMADEKGAWL